jgi:hypothetical protein
VWRAQGALAEGATRQPPAFRRGHPVLLTGIAECPCQIAAAVEDAIDGDPVACDVECDRHPPSKADDAEPGTQIVAASLALRERRETKAIGDDPVGVGAGARGSGLTCDVVV